MENENLKLSKKERWEARKQERTDAASGLRRKRLIKRILLWAIALTALGGSVLGLALIVMNSESLNKPGDLTIPVSGADWSKGPAEAQAVLVEYSDFQCPACKSYHPLLKQLNEEFPGKIKFVYRHFPLSQIHQNAQLAAYAAEAAGLQGKFWEMHDLIFDGQEKWSIETARDAANDFIHYAESLDLDSGKLASDMDLSEIKQKVDLSYAGGSSAGVNSTPTFFLNGKKIPNPRTYDEFKKIIDAVLGEAGDSNS